MNRFERVVQILDVSVGGPASPVSFHGAFWRGVSRNDFVAKKIFGLQLVTIGNGAGSLLIKALKGELPFGADTGNADADFNRMPSGRPPLSDDEIAFIQKWIDEGCLEDPYVGVAPLAWRKTNAAAASSRTDDIWFHDAKTGWAVNSDGNIISTRDGGDSWVVQHAAPGVYLRCIGFANANVGWVGSLSRNRRLFQTSNGGASWANVTNLPAGAPVAICGISVVNNQVVYGSGTNRPEDSPGIIKTTDGGLTWMAIDMSAHASILIDTFFTDASHGWVVGGKANATTPPTRDSLKPVVLETNDGGATWNDRLAGMEAEFPFGEWGWKIQFLNDKLGFVSLENFTAGAILKTTDGGRTWTRIKINDPQGNVNLEGVGFIDENRGWVGGWGSDFSPPGPTGFSSSTTDGGVTWANANDIGLRINRFRFFGDPVTVGYASGATVYKYSQPSTMISASLVAAAPTTRMLLPAALANSGTLPISIRMEIPIGTRRLTLHVWDRFGVDHGVILDEIRPESGSRQFHWDGLNERGEAIATGDYILRAIADDAVASSTISYRKAHDATALTEKLVAPRIPAFASPGRPKLTTLDALMKEPKHDLQWLMNALQVAIQLELATLPPYLLARWTLKPPTAPVGPSIREIRGEEMLHFALVGNLLVAIGGTPLLADETVVPKYPGPLTGGVRPGLIVGLRKLTRQQAGVFMEIEYPQDGPIVTTAVAATYDSIGEFYEAIWRAFNSLNPPLSTDRQLTHDGDAIAFEKIDTLAKVEAAIMLIKVQGEGSNLTPEEASGDLAHYYRFGEIYHGKKFIQDATGMWGFTGADIPLPDTWDMADIPAGGYQQADVPQMDVWDMMTQFDQNYSEMLRNLQAAWTHGDPLLLDAAITNMRRMNILGTQIVQKPKPGGGGNYGPCFRYVQ